MRHPPDEDPGTAAFSLLRELYFWFGFTEQHMPYVQREGERGRITPGWSCRVNKGGTAVSTQARLILDSY